MKSNRSLILNCLLIVILFVSCQKKNNTPIRFLPTVTTTAVSEITLTSANIDGSVSSNGGYPLTAWGVCWGTASGPTLANSFLQNDLSSGGFSSALSELTPNTTYYVRAYATNFLGTSYGNELIFTTSAIVLPTVTTTAVSESTGCSAISGGAVTSNGGASLSAWGVCWGTASNPTLTNSFLQNNLSSGGFSTALTGLTANTMYYVRAYATNSAGIAYGNQVSFTTPVFCIGQSYQGGIIAYILQPGDIGYDSNVLHGLIAAPSDQAAQWGCLSTLISGADGTTIGTGNQNTIDIMNGCNESAIAARICGNLVLGTYSDWYLPSIDELYKMYINRVAIGGFINFDFYLSSSESSETSVWGLNFNFGGSSQPYSHFGKSNTASFRAVRSF
jgi:hypothetical protein